MPEPGGELSIDAQIQTVAQQLGRAVLGRELNPDEADAMIAVIKAATDALREGHGFLHRLAEQVRAERETENVEEFFEGIIKAD